MSPEVEAKLAKVRRYSASLRAVFTVAQFVFGLGAVATLFLLAIPGGDDATLAIWDVEFRGGEITLLVKLLGAIWILIVFGIAVKLLRHMRNLFDLYAQGRIFTAADVEQIRKIGVTVLLFSVTWIYAIAAKIVLLASGHSLVAIDRATENLGPGMNFPVVQIVAGIMIIVISWIMDVGRELREEQDLTV